MSSTRFTQQHIIELNEKPASSLLMNRELQNIYEGANELDDEAKIHRAKQADPTLADTATEKHVTNAQTKKWEDTANAFSGVSPSSFVAATEVVTTATANKILKLNADGKLPTSITGDADTVDGKHAAAFQEVSQKDQPGGYAGLDATGKIPGELLNITDPVWGSISGTLANQTDLQAALDEKIDAALVSPAMTGSATLNGTTDNTVQLTGIVTTLGLEVGDVIRIQYSGYDKLHTVESITDDNSIIVNYEHAGNRGDGSLKLTDTTTSVTVTRIAKWFNAPVGLGQAWQGVTSSRAVGTTYTNTTGRTIVVIINTGTNNGLHAEVDGFPVYANYTGGSSLPRGSVTILVPHGSTYRLVSGGSSWIWGELR